MLTSIILARVFGLFFTIIGIAMLVRGKSLQLVISEIIERKSTFFILNIMTLIFGIILILINNIWVAGWPVFITLLCWFIFITALIRLFFLEKVQAIGLRIVNHPNFHLKGIIPLVIGVICLYLGFILV